MKNHLYTWSGVNEKNKKISGEIIAFSLNLAKVTLQQQGIQGLTIQKKRKKFFSKINRKITKYDIANFYRQLATLISAGIPLVQCCETLAQSQDKILLKNLILSLKKEIEAGNHFAKSLLKFPDYFDPISCQLLKAGEQSGTLDIMLNRVANYQEKNIQLKKQIQQALFYPITICIVAVIITIIMLIFVIPRFEELFNSMHSQLPALTRFIVFISHCIRENIWLGFLPVIFYFLSSYFFKNSIRLKKIIDTISMKTPILQTLLQKIILARVSRCLSTLFSAGIPITEALRNSATICNHYHYTRAINQLQSEITSGQQLHAAMSRSDLFPPLTIQMIKIGEESGALEKMLDKIAEIYETEVNHFVTNLNQLLEPLIMVVLGIIIGSLVIAMYLPIFKLGSVI